MRSISLRDDVEQVILQYVRALPDVFMDYDISRVELVTYNEAEAYDEDRHQQASIYSADIVFVESDETEIVLGELSLGTDLFLEISIYSDETGL